MEVAWQTQMAEQKVTDVKCLFQVLAIDNRPLPYLSRVKDINLAKQLI